ncbi:MAG: DUF4089 domain-containing protein [Nostocaceae cyanobacterium]|nr:DUF4089 domain-containing protein [Nostocaceae cyanobacterium]
MTKNIDAAEYVTQMALMIDLPIDNEYHQGVVENFQRISFIAQLVNEFPLPENVEAAPVFEP